ncbi:MAG: ATP-binding protein [Polaromonas sp.]
MIRLFVVSMLLWVGLATDGYTATMELREANVTVFVGDVATQTTSTLPYNWDHVHRGQPGTATFDIFFSLPDTAKDGASNGAVELYDVYFSRLGTAYEVSLNGTVIERNGDQQVSNGADFALVPRVIALPPRLLRKDNQFHIRIRADAGRRAGVARPVIGTDREIQALYKTAYWSRVTGSEVVLILSLLVGMAALALWFTQADLSQPRHLVRDHLYLFAGLAELCWALRVGAVLIEHPPLPWFLWGPLNVVALGGWVLFMMAFCCATAGWMRHRMAIILVQGIWVILGLGAVAAFSVYAWQLQWLLTLWYGMLAVIALPFGIFYFWATVRKPTAMRMLVAIAVILNVVVGLRDFVVFRLTDSFGLDTWTRYSSVLFGLTLGYIVMARFRTVSTQARDLAANLAARVRQKEEELALTYQRVERLAREQERAWERTRILRDMHDGVGSHISTAIRQLESGRASPGEVLQTLRDSLDQLKLSIDAMNLPPGDITALLANLRYRLQPRFIASDIELQWDVDLLPVMERLDDKAMRHLQFMVFEALSNVLQHAQASSLRIELRATVTGGAQLRVVDNGCGFAPERVARRGLGSLRERAAAIDARLAITSSPGNTVVEILLE